jgi:anti-sigma-K factor RskA
VNAPGEHKSWRADLVAYLLGSLEDDERAAVEQHLEGCEACREELRWLQPAVDLLPESVAQVEPPPQLRERLLAEVSADPDAAPARHAPERKPAGRGLWRGFLLRPATGFAVLALAAAAVIGYTLNDGGSGPQTTTVRAQGAGSLRATLERSGDSGTLKLTGLAQAPSARVYQAWVQEPGGRIDAVGSLFDARHNGTANVSLERHLDRAKVVMVTAEPRRGSSQPTSPPLISVPTTH